MVIPLFFCKRDEYEQDSINVTDHALNWSIGICDGTNAGYAACNQAWW